MWPTDPEALIAVQQRLAVATPEPWVPGGPAPRIGGCWVCFSRGLTGRGSAQDPAWAAAVVMARGVITGQRVSTGRAGAPYTPGLLALRLGPLMDQAVRRLTPPPDVLLVDGTARDHPRRAGLALHLGAELDLPTIGITHRPLVATGGWPEDRRGAIGPLVTDGEVVGCWVRTQPGVRPLAVHPGWRVDLDTAVHLVLSSSARRRTPEPLRQARRLARAARARSSPERPGAG
jgi:deoxyribonuclease V